MKIETYDKILFLLGGILIGMIFILLIMSGVFDNLFQDEIEVEVSEETKTESEEDIIKNCSNLDVVNASYCLRDNIEKFFVYNLTDDDLNLTIQDLKNRGGDCKNWAILYSILGKELNFNSTTVRNEGIIDLFDAHLYAVLWNEENYCKLDMLKVKCYEKKDE